MRARLVAAAAAILCCVTATAAFADATPGPLPSIPQSVLNNPLVQSLLNAAGGLLQTTNGPTAHGRVSYFKRFDLQVQTAPGVYRQIHLHQGTVINPRGTSLSTGMIVNVSGDPRSDGSLEANTITVNP